MDHALLIVPGLAAALSIALLTLVYREHVRDVFYRSLLTNVGDDREHELLQRE
jgi:hypothetical protein